MVTTDISSNGNDEAYAIALQTDGKIVVAGREQESGLFNFVIVRLNASDGSLDTSFGTAGVVTTDISSSGNDGGYALAIQIDGKIVVAGRSQIGGNYDFALTRYNGGGGISGGGSSGGSSGGGNGGCVINPNGDFDLTLIGILGWFLFYMGWLTFRKHFPKSY